MHEHLNTVWFSLWNRAIDTVPVSPDIFLSASIHTVGPYKEAQCCRHAKKCSIPHHSGSFCPQQSVGFWRYLSTSWLKVDQFGEIKGFGEGGGGGIALFYVWETPSMLSTGPQSDAWCLGDPIQDVSWTPKWCIRGIAQSVTVIVVLLADIAPIPLQQLLLVIVLSPLFRHNLGKCNAL